MQRKLFKSPTVFQDTVKNMRINPIRRAQLLSFTELKYDMLEIVQSDKFIDHTNNFPLEET